MVVDAGKFLAIWTRTSSWGRPDFYLFITGIQTLGIPTSAQAVASLEGRG